MRLCKHRNGIQKRNWKKKVKVEGKDRRHLFRERGALPKQSWMEMTFMDCCASVVPNAYYT